MQVHSPLVPEPLSMMSKDDPANVLNTECDDEYDISSLRGKARTDKKRSWGIRKGLRMLSGGNSTGSDVSSSSGGGSHLRSSSGSFQSIKYSNSDPSVESFFPSGEFTLPRSILKGSKTRASSSGTSTVSTKDLNKDCTNVQKEKKKIRFHGIMSLCKICKVESYIQYKDEIWWSREEIDSHKSEQSDFRSASSETKAIARSYLKAVRKGRSDIYDHFKQQTNDAATATASAAVLSSSSESPTLPQHVDCGTSNDCSASFTTATTASSSSSCTNSPKQSATTAAAGVKLTKPTIDNEIHTALVQGRANGFAGLELYAYSSNENRATVKSIVKNVVSYYRSRKDPATVKDLKNYILLEEKISNYCKSLTVADRYWAVIVAKVDQEGATTC